MKNYFEIKENISDCDESWGNVFEYFSSLHNKETASSTKRNNNTITAQKKVIFTTETFIPNIVGPTSEATER